MLRRNLIRTAFVKRFKRCLMDYLWTRCRLLGLSLQIILLASSIVLGQDNWQGPTTDASWFTSGNWTLGNPPTANQNALINNGTTAVFNGTETFGTADALMIGTTVSGSTLQVLSGTLSVNSVEIGTGGTIRFSGGLLEVATSPILNNGTILFDGSPDEGSGVDVIGSGQLIMNLTGTLFVSANNTYSGGTILLAGTLQANSTTALSPNSAFALNSNTILDLDGFSNTIGSLSGTGTVLNSSATAATLTVGHDNTDTTFAGILKDGNGVLALTKSGMGSLTLTGENTYTGTTTVDNGSLIVDGSIASPLTTVNSGGTLAGHGIIGGNLVNNGTVGQGNSPGTLTVNGNYTQGAGGLLRIGVGGLGAGQHDLLAVNGSAAVGGTLQFIRLGNFNLQPGDQVTFLTAKNGVTGTFGTVQNGLLGTGTIVQVEVTSLGNSVVLEGTQGSFANTPGVAVTPNERAVAKALDSARGDPREAALFAFLNSQPLADLPHDLSLIAPSQISSINATAVSVGKVQVSNIGQRLANVHAGSTGFSSTGFSLNGGTASFGEGFAGVSGPEGKSGPAVFAPTPDNRWGVFVTGLGEFTNVDSTTNAAGYNVDTGGFTFGFDYRLTPNFAIGLTAGYAHTTVNLDGGGNIDVNGGKMGLYATLLAMVFIWMPLQLEARPDITRTGPPSRVLPAEAPTEPTSTLWSP